MWTERILVSLAPHALHAVRLSAGPRRRVLERQSIAATPLDALAQAMPGWGARRAAVRIVLANALVRYALVPHAERLADADERAALARARFARIHGDRAAQWQVRMAVPSRHDSGLAVAVDAELLQGITAAFRPYRRLRLVSVQPYLVCAYNRWARNLPRNGGWLLLAEPERLCLALIDAQGWRSVSLTRAPAGQALDALEREAARLAGSTPKSVLAVGSDALPEGSEWQVRALSPGDPDYAMALSAA